MRRSSSCREGGALPASDLLKRATRLTQQAGARDNCIRALARVEEMAAEEVSAQVQWFGDKVIAALAVALADTIEQARVASATLHGTLPGRDVIAACLVGEEVRNAYGVLVAQGARYGQIRGARFSLMLLGIRAQRDESNIFLEFKNFDVLWPNFRKGGDPPWPADALERLLWIVNGPTEPWVPTGARARRSLCRVRRGGHGETASLPDTENGSRRVIRRFRTDKAT